MEFHITSLVGYGVGTQWQSSFNFFRPGSCCLEKLIISFLWQDSSWTVTKQSVQWNVKATNAACTTSRPIPHTPVHLTAGSYNIYQWIIKHDKLSKDTTNKLSKYTINTHISFHQAKTLQQNSFTGLFFCSHYTYTVSVTVTLTVTVSQHHYQFDQFRL